MAENAFLYIVTAILYFVITPGMTSRSVQYLNNPGLAGKKCPSTELVFTETANSVLQCTTACQSITGCASAFFNHVTGTCYGCYGYYDVDTTIVILDDESDTTYHYTDFCQPGWTRHGFSCYTYSMTNRTWQNSLDECRSVDGSLVEITDSDENSFLSKILPSGINVWIGLNHLAGDGVWRWAGSNLVATYEAWFENEPNGGSYEQCASYRYPGNGWTDYPCSIPFPFVCERTLLCPIGWTRRGNSCYQLSQDQINWVNAMNYCLTQNAYLVEINDAEENKFIQTMNTEGHELWLGLNDRDSENTFIWAGSNASATYTPWNQNEPKGSTDENCVCALPNSGWNDAPCSSYTCHYVCEKAVEFVKTKIGG